MGNGHDWNGILGELNFALQPIVDIDTGKTFAFEALLRGHDAAGFASPHGFFDQAWRDGVLYQSDLRLRRKAVEQFTALDLAHTRLFYNLDNRVLEMPDYSPGNTSRLLAEFDLEPGRLIFEISERYEFRAYQETQKVLELYKSQGYGIAVDDFGAGYSGLRLLYHSQPDLIKIDRFFIDGIDHDSRKMLFIGKIVDMAHVMGRRVVAEGVETRAELNACRSIGCDFVQGYLVQRPSREPRDAHEVYEHIAPGGRARMAG